VESMFDEIARYRDRVIPDHIMPSTRWRAVVEQAAST